MNYRDTINYFTSLATSHVDIKQSYHGDYKEILRSQETNIEYPVLWIESPDASIQGTPDSKVLDWSGALVVLVSNPEQSFDQANTNIDISLDIALEIISKMIKDYEEDIFDGLDVNSIDLDMVWSDNGDDAQGWRIQYAFKAKEDKLCYNQSKWN